MCFFLLQPLRSEASRPPPSRYDSRPPELPSNDTRPPDSHRAYSRPNTDPYGATLAIGMLSSRHIYDVAHYDASAEINSSCTVMYQPLISFYVGPPAKL